MTVSSTQLLPYANGSTNNATDIGSYGKAWKNIYASSTAFLSYVSSTAMDSITLNLTGSSTLTLTGSTTDANTGVIYKGTESFIHNFSHPTGSSAVPDGQNTFVGLQAGNFTMGSGATAVYHGSQNTGIGYQTLKSLTTGYQNTAIGRNALGSITSGYNNTALGINALQTLSAGVQNLAIGTNALYYNSGNYNTAVGGYTLFNNTTAGYNVALGNDAGRYIANGEGANSLTSTSVYIGANTKSSISGAYNENVFGYNATGMGSSTVVLGNTSILQTYLRGDIFNSSTLYVGGGTGASTSTFANGLQTTALNVTSATVSSTFANGIDISDGCFAMDGVCLSVGASGANVNLSNLESVAINTSLLSDANNTDDLGAYGYAWKNLYVSSTSYLESTQIMGSTADGSNLLASVQSSTGRAGYFTRNTASGARPVVSIEQNHASGGSQATLHLVQKILTSPALGINNGNSLTDFDMTVLGDGTTGVGTSTPWAQLSVHAKNGNSKTSLFAIASSTQSTTSTLFIVKNFALEYPPPGALLKTVTKNPPLLRYTYVSFPVICIRR